MTSWKDWKSGVSLSRERIHPDEQLPLETSAVKSFRSYLTFATQSIKRKKIKQVFSGVSLSHSRHQSLLLRPIRAFRVSGGDLEPSGNSPDKLDRWRHIQNRRGRGRLETRLAAPQTGPHLHVKLTPPFIRNKKTLQCYVSQNVLGGAISTSNHMTLLFLFFFSTSGSSKGGGT